MITTIMRQDWQRLWSAPLLWVLAAVLAFAQAWLSLLLLQDYQPLQSALLSLENPPGVTDLVIIPQLRLSAWLTLLALPVLGMRALSEERRHNTLALLLSAPLPLPNLVLGKFCALWLAAALFSLFACLPALSLLPWVGLDLGKLASAGLGMLSLSAAACAIALYTSSLSAQPALAALITLAFYALIWLLSLSLGETSSALLPFARFDRLLNGLVTSTDASYFLLVTLLFLGLTVQRLDRLRLGRAQRWSGLVWLLLWPLCIGQLLWLTHQHLDGRSDWSNGARNTLNPRSQTLVAQLTGPVQVTAYARPIPALQRAIESLLERYRQFYPHFNLRIVDPDTVPDELKQRGIEQQGALYIEYAGRSTVVTRPTEAAFSSGIARLLHSHLPRIALLHGHGERALHGSAGDSWSNFAQALERDGLAVETLDFNQALQVPSSIALLVIAGPRTALLSGEVTAVQNYLGEGRNLLWLSDLGTQDGLTPLAEQLGVQRLPGQVVDAEVSKLGITDPTTVAISQYGEHRSVAKLNTVSLLPSVQALAARRDLNWQVTPLLLTQERTWTETSPISGHIRYEPAQGERAGPLSLGFALERPSTDTRHPQRVVVIGDSDFLSNRYLGSGGNQALGLSLMHWLVNQDNLLGIDSRPAPDVSMQLEQHTLTLLGLLHLLLVPISLLALAGWRAWQRR